MPNTPTFKIYTISMIYLQADISYMRLQTALGNFYGRKHGSLLGKLYLVIPRTSRVSIKLYLAMVHWYIGCIFTGGFFFFWFILFCWEFKYYACSIVYEKQILCLLPFSYILLSIVISSILSVADKAYLIHRIYNGLWCLATSSSNCASV